MKHAKLTTDEIIEAEQAKDARQRSRKKGFSKMHERDKGEAILSNGCLIYWPVEEIWSEPTNDGIETMNGRRIPESMFVLKFAGKELLFDAEEFRRHLRWV